jgi:hypothetical protein
MHTARRLVLTLALTLTPAITPTAAAQDTAQSAKPADADTETREPTALEESPVAVMAGSWEGTGVYQTGPGQSEEVSVTETAQWRLGSNAILVNGIGTATDDDGTERTVHDAVGVIRYDEEGKLVIHAFKADAAPSSPRSKSWTTAASNGASSPARTRPSASASSSKTTATPGTKPASSAPTAGRRGTRSLR